jgi:hypothetical protein
MVGLLSGILDASYVAPGLWYCQYQLGDRMRLLASTDFALRILMLLAPEPAGTRMSVATLAHQLGDLSRNHLHKIVQELTDRRRGRRVTALAFSSPLPYLTQRPIDRGGAHRQQTRANLRRESTVAVPLHRLDQDRNQRP